MVERGYEYNQGGARVYNLEGSNWKKKKIGRAKAIKIKNLGINF